MTRPQQLANGTNEAGNDLQKMSFLEHLDELRRRLISILLALIVAFFICWFFAGPIYDFLSQPIRQMLPEGQDKLVFTKLTDPFFLYVKVAFLAAIFLSAPWTLTQFWNFVAPGLYRKEKRYAIPFVFFATSFFIGGAAFGFYIAFPVMAKFFLNLGDRFTPLITIQEYLALLNRTLLGLGLVFQMPVLTFFLAKIGIVTHRFLIRQFKYALLIIFVIAALITPSGDIPTQLVFATPMLLLYGLGIVIAYFVARGDEK